MIPLYETVTHRTFCQKEFDVYGDHFLSCKTAGQRIEPHNALVRYVHNKLKEVRIPLTVNLSVTEKDIMGDLVLKNWKNDRDLFLDFSVAEVLGLSSRHLWAKEKLGAAEKRYKEKTQRKERKVCASEGNRGIRTCSSGNPWSNPFVGGQNIKGNSVQN
jgi:hypothetical protein